MSDIKKEENTSAIVINSLAEYGAYTIEDRAIPDVRDGLKPAQRRIMFALHRLKRTSKTMPVKSARVVGDTIGQFHPHGDSACYDTLVNLTHLRYPIADGSKSNFGNPNTLVDTGYADKRYTETRMTAFGDRLFDDISVIPTQPTFDEEDDEPIILPVRVPLLLVNGSSGTALGLKTTIPPHNLDEVIDATQYLIENPECSVTDLMKYIKGPDYGNGAILSGKREIKELYETGKGKISYTCNYRYEEGRKGVSRLVVTGMAPGFRKSRFVKVTKNLADQKLLVDAARDDGTIEEPTRFVVEFKDPNIVNDRVLPLLNTSISYQMYALGPKKRPKKFNLKEMLQAFVQVRRTIESRVLKEERASIQKKLLVTQAKKAAVNNMDVLRKVQSEAKSDEEAVKMLASSKKLNINEEQAIIILDASFRSLLRANRKSLSDKEKEHKDRLRDIKEGLDNIDGVVSSRLEEMRKYVTKRETRLRGDVKEVEDNVETTYHIGITPELKVDSFVELPTKSKAAWNYVKMVQTKLGFVVVDEDNLGQSIKLSYLDKLDTKGSGKIIGVSRLEDDCMIAISEKGKYVAFPPDQRRTQYPVFRNLDDDDHIVYASGFNEGDILYVWFDDGTVEELDKLQVTRPNVAPKKIKKGSKITRLVTRALVVPSDTVTLSIDGDEYNPTEFELDESILVVSNENLVIMGDGRRLVKDFDGVVKLIEKGDEVTMVNPLMPIDE